MVIVRDDLIDSVEGRTLFLAVLMQGIKDHIADLDRAWLSLYSDDYHTICHLAGLDPWAVIHALRSRDGKRLRMPAVKRRYKRPHPSRR